MDDSTFSNYPPELTSEQETHLVSSIKNWTAYHGLSVRPAPTFVHKDVDPSGVLVSNAPVTLFPSPFPKRCYETAVALQKIYNALYASISTDEAWLGMIIEE